MHLRTERDQGWLKMAVALVVVAACLVASPADAQQRRSPELQTKETAAVVAGATSWVALNWLGIDDAKDFRVRVENANGSNEAKWAYPENTSQYTSLSRDAELQAGELDYTALQVTVPYEQRSSFTLNLRVTWNDGRDNRSEAFRVVIPVASFDGEDLKQVTEQVTVASGSDTWVEVKYTGGAPRLENFEVRIDMTDEELDGAVVYPGEDDHTSLHHDDILLAGETDVARFLVLSPDGPAGTVEVPLEVTYTKGRERVTESFTLMAEVT